jgi:hypothetical protein
MFLRIIVSLHSKMSVTELKTKLRGLNPRAYYTDLATDPEVRVRFPALPDFLRNSGSGMGSTQPREYN